MYQEALNDFSAVLQIDPTFYKAYKYRGRCAFLQDDINLAYTEFQKLLFEQPNDPQAHLQAGDLLLLNNCTKDALKAYKNSLSHSKTTEVFIRSIKCFLIMNDLKKASEEVADLLTFENNKQLLQDFNVLKGLELFEAGFFKEALKVFSEISKDGLVISAREVSKFLALGYFYAGDFKHAVSLFKERKNEELADQDDCGFNLALCYAQIGQFELAITHLNELAYISSGDDKAKVLYLIGFLHLGLQNENDGKDFIKAAKKMGKNLKTQENDEIELFPFASNKEFSLKFPVISLKFGLKTVKTRPSFGLPIVELPVFDFPVDLEIVQQVSLKSIKCKPEAPWLNRVQGMIQFTDEVQEVQSETATESIVDQQEEPEEDVFEDHENFKKYRSAICLPRQESDKLFESMRAALE
jgi:tetratricopeptide (TPR) repeat protein